MSDNSRIVDIENPAPIIGAGDQERPEAAKARVYEYHKNNGTIGAYYQLYPTERTDGDLHARNEAHRAAREALERHIEAPNHGPSLDPSNRARGLER
jgi:hypothetical protein